MIISSIIIRPWLAMSLTQKEKHKKFKFKYYLPRRPYHLPATAKGATNGQTNATAFTVRDVRDTHNQLLAHNTKWTMIWS